ncbi:hypothetical protein NQ176_g11145 [Zarea fungicola]|uniref:Uncharacterized protein n=1 Tax=Zarea fungicola TaxID=93591 RepID=A0ACC1MDY8_9HYPO|nr:hypothetical protein NQ176_g11145 [Lecanicillium fungicola]
MLDPRGVKDEVVYVAGDTLSYSEVGDLVDAHYGETFQRELWDSEVLDGQMKEDPNAMVKYRATFARGLGVAWSMEETVNYERGFAMTNVKKYLEEIVDKRAL